MIAYIKEKITDLLNIIQLNLIHDIIKIISAIKCCMKIA